MAGLKSNLAASLLSKLWTALLSLAAVPLYIQYLGVEAYGLIGAFIALQAVLTLLDLGLGPTLTREFARMQGHPSQERAMTDLLRTLEVIYWLIAALILLVLWLGSRFIAGYWLQPERLTQEEVAHALLLAGAAFALQWPANLYSGGLTGLQKQSALAALTAATSTARVVLTLAALAFVAPTLSVFFQAQALANLLQTACLAAYLWSQLPGRRAARFDRARLAGVLHFAGGMLGISITTVVLTQLDKAILSKTLSLQAFGYYAVANTLAAGLYVFISPLFAVFFPRFSQLVAQGDNSAVERLYHRSSQLMVIAIVPVALVCAFFAADILGAWTGREDIAAQSGLVFALLILGNAMNGLMNMPYAVQLAHGWTSLPLYSNIVAIVVLAPLMYLLSSSIGALGGALGWLLLTAGYLLVSLQIMHRRIPALGSKWRWYLADVALPAAAALVVTAAARALVPEHVTLGILVVALLGVTAAALAASVLAAAEVRGLALAQVRRWLQ